MSAHKLSLWAEPTSPTQSYSLNFKRDMPKVKMPTNEMLSLSSIELTPTNDTDNLPLR